MLLKIQFKKTFQHHSMIILYHFLKNYLIIIKNIVFKKKI